jgi:hypothetical protein
VREKQIEENFHRGDYFSLYETIEKLLFAYPNRAEAFLYVYDIARLGDVVGREKALATLEKLEKLHESTSGGEKSGGRKLAIFLEKEKLLMSSNQDKAVKISQMLFPIRNWVIMGPYWKYGPGDLYAPFLPENADSLSHKELSVRRVRLEGDGTLHFGRFLYPAAGVAYAACSFRAMKEIKMRVYSDERYALFVNGRQVLTNDENSVKRRLRIVRLWGSDEFTVMLKVHKKSSWSFRVIITDANDVPLRLPIELDRMYRADFRYAEEMEYPFTEIMEIADEGTRLAALGSFFDELDSDESLRFYKKAFEKRGTIFAKYIYAAALLGYGGEQSDSARNLEGRRLMKEVHDADPLMVPALHKRFRAIYDSRDHLAALKFGKKMYDISKNYFPFRRDYIRLLRFLDYRKEFEDEIALLKKDFPASIGVLKEEAAYHRARNPEKAAKLRAAILDKEYDSKTLSRLIRYLKKKGEEGQALREMKRRTREDDLWYDHASLLIALNRFDEAKKLLFAKLLKREEPDCYRLLGYLDAKAGDDPLMQWKRELELNPSNFSLEEYVGYLEKASLVLPKFVKRHTSVDAMLNKWKIGAYDDMPSGVLYRGRSYELLADGGSRAYCEDLLYLKDKKSIERWGEYQVIYRGEFKPVTVRVYHKDGGFTEAFSVQDVDGDKYINLPSLNEKSLVHVAYIAENPIKDPAYANLFALPATEICDYDEPVKKFFFSVSVPENLKCNFIVPESAVINKITSGSVSTYSFTMENIPPIVRERFSGNRLRVLPFLAFSTMDNPDDFVAWYRGLLVGVFDIDEKMCREAFSGRGIELVEKVYEAVSRNIELENRMLYFPVKASDVFYKKRASAEGKVILAKSILERFGILSYIAFARRNDRPAFSNYISPDVFTDILLCIPLSSEETLWLDFSSMEYACGDVNPLLDGVDALLVVGSGHERKRVAGKQQGRVKGFFRIEIGSSGDASLDGKVELYGPRGDFRRKLQDPFESEKSVRKYFGYLFSSFDMDDFSVMNVREYAKPLVLAAKGACHGLTLPTKTGIIVKASPCTSEATEYVMYASRVHPLFIGEAVVEDDEYEYVLPDNARVESLPEKCSHESRFGVLTLDARYDIKKNAIIVRKKIVLRSGSIAPEEYADFLHFSAKIKEAEQKSIVIKL